VRFSYGPSRPLPNGLFLPCQLIVKAEVFAAKGTVERASPLLALHACQFLVGIASDDTPP
jgi:hypothetical protein